MDFFSDVFIKPVNVVHVQRMRKPLRWLVIELQHGAGGPSATGATGGGGGVANSAAGAGGQHGQGGLDPRFPEDGTQ